MSHEAMWYLTRASAITAWVFLTLTVVWGALVSGKFVNRKGGRRWLLDLHPYLGGLGLVALIIHIATAVVNSYVGLTWVDAVLPFGAVWQRVGIGVGTLGLWLLVAVEVTSMARRRMRRSTWKRVHLLSYGMAWMMAIHAVAVGTDLANPVIAWGSLILVAATTGLAIVRALQSRRPGRETLPSRTNPHPTPVGFVPPSPRPEPSVLVSTGAPS